MKESNVKAVYCAWCKTWISGDQSIAYDDSGVSHGMCIDCKIEQMERLEEYRRLKEGK